MRHGHADQDGNDHERCLSEKGQNQIRSVANQLLKENVEIHQVFHSGLKRAFETADIVMQVNNLQCDLAASKGLLPNDDVGNWGEQIKLLEKVTLFVGHNPYMSDLVNYLTDQPTNFATGQLVCLEILENDVNVLWTLTP